MFIGRKNEILQLNQLYNSGKFEFAVIYGRRRVGKTAIINEFIKNKDSVFFTGVETNEKQNLENLSKCILEFYTGISTDFSFASFQAALEYVFKLSENRRIILCIDEYPYVARSSSSLASTLQYLIDKYKDTSKLFLILCGSSMSYMEDNVLAYKAPLYGRRTAQFKILPFEFKETLEYLQNFSDEDKALIYGLIGGTPQYLLQINTALSVEENIKNIFLNPNSSIFEEPNNLLKQEVREPAIYNAVISAIASGASKLSEIANKIGEDTSTCAVYIKNLVSLGIIKKENPYNDISTRKTVYSIEDNMFRFWYRFIPENMALITRNMADIALSRITPFLSDYMGSIFEEICKQYLWDELSKGRSAIIFTDMGRWWGTNHKTKKQIEIDIMASENKEVALFAECKWTNAKIDSGVLEKLIELSELFHFNKKYYYLFSKTGFTQSCIDEAEKIGNVKLVQYCDMLKK